MFEIRGYSPGLPVERADTLPEALEKAAAAHHVYGAMVFEVEDGHSEQLCTVANGGVLNWHPKALQLLGL